MESLTFMSSLPDSCSGKYEGELSFKLTNLLGPGSLTSFAHRQDSSIINILLNATFSDFWPAHDLFNAGLVALFHAYVFKFVSWIFHLMIFL